LHIKRASITSHGALGNERSKPSASTEVQNDAAHSPQCETCTMSRALIQLGLHRERIPI